MRLALAGMTMLVALPASAATLTIHVTGIQSQQGKINVAVCNGGFDVQGCPYGALLPPTMPSMDVVFPDLPDGRYAIAVYHDEDDDGELNKNVLTLPTEPYGFSNDIGRMGMPTFADGLVDVKGDTTIQVTVKPLFGG